MRTLMLRKGGSRASVAENVHRYEVALSLSSMLSQGRSEHRFAPEVDATIEAEISVLNQGVNLS